MSIAFKALVHFFWALGGLPMWVHLDDKLDEQITNEIDRQEDRSAAIIAGSFLENRLVMATQAQFKHRNKSVENALFKGVGPMATFSSKIDFGFLLGLYEDHLRQSLHVIRQIRNAFAHTMTPITFDAPQIKVLTDKFLSAESMGQVLADKTKDGLSDEHLVTKLFGENIALRPDSSRNRFMAGVQILLFMLSMRSFAP
jgi:hypothetical protein